MGMIPAHSTVGAQEKQMGDKIPHFANNHLTILMNYSPDACCALSDLP